MHKITTAQTNRVLTLLDSGTSAAKISQELNLGLGTISRIRAQHRSNLPKSSGGHLVKHSSANIDYARCVIIICMGKVDNAVQMAKALQNATNQSISAQTVHRQIKSKGMRAVVKRKRPLLKPHHRRARMEFAERHLEWTIEDWKKVWWSDETKINHLGSDGRQWVWKKDGEGLSDRLVEGTKKFGGGSLMMWGCMTWEGVGYACKIDGKMDGDLYVKILDEDLQESIKFYDKTKDDIIFQQDNDPKHTCKKAKQWFQDHEYQVMDWPAQSPDINPIEHLWHHLKRRLAEYEIPPKGILELWDRVEEEWNKIPSKVCQNLIESMPRHVEAVIKAKGGYTKY